MKRTLLAFATLALISQATATDLSKTVWSFISGQSRQQPMLQSSKDGKVAKVWMVPEDLQAPMVMFSYLPKLSTNHWAFILFDPQLPAGDYFGTNKWTPGPVIKDDKFKMSFKQLTGGMFDGLYIADEKITEDGETHRLIVLMTPQMLQNSQNVKKAVQR